MEGRLGKSLVSLNKNVLLHHMKRIQSQKLTMSHPFPKGQF